MSEVASFRAEFEQLISDTSAYLDEIAVVIEPHFRGVFIGYAGHQPDQYWDHVPDNLRIQAESLTKRLLEFAGRFAPVLKIAPLANESDQREIVLGTKTIRAAIHLRRFRHYDADYLHDEDRVLGVQPSRQTDGESLNPREAENLIVESSKGILSAVQLVEASGSLSGANASSVAEKGASAARYRPSTGFVMMWMDRSKPDLEDVSVAVKEVFSEFDIKAVRADDIEHEGLITQRVLNEIATSEFLFADLTGARPNVYYEVGYAHALGKRVILFRNGETPLHFDLAGYNCPSYLNNKDLKEKLRK